MSIPRARTDGVTTALDGVLVVVVDDDGSEIARLDPLDAAVWRLADGSRSVGEIAAQIGTELGEPIPTSQVWASLDVLADCHLLASRAAPPAGDAGVGGSAPGDPVGRRTLLGKLGLVGGVAAATLVAKPMVAAAKGKGDDDDDKRGSNRGGLPACRAEEQTAKEANDKQSGLVDALRDMEQEDKATILTLRNQEVSSKEQAGKLQDKLQACEASSKEQHAKPPPPAQPKQPAARSTG